MHAYEGTDRDHSARLDELIQNRHVADVTILAQSALAEKAWNEDVI